MRVHNFDGTRGIDCPRGIGRWLVDCVLALALFWLAVCAIDGPQNHAHAIALPARAPAFAQPTAVHAWDHAAQTELRVTRELREDHTRDLVLLSIAFAVLAACNLAYVRHLRRVYASPRRGVWRRG